MKPLIVLLACVMFCSVGRAEDSDFPIVGLPAAVVSGAGEISLHADYGGKAADGTIPVYLINRSGKVLTLKAQDGDVYLKLETQDKEGKWIRAQSHAFSWCGNSYMYSPTVRTDHFLKVAGYQPKAGDARKIRFSLYQQAFRLSSNIGMGLVSAKDIELAASDEMDRRAAPTIPDKKK